MMHAWIAPPAALDWLWRVTWQSSVLALLVLALQALLRKRLSVQWSFALWWLVLLRLVLPGGLPASWSAFNLFPEGAGKIRTSPVHTPVRREIVAIKDRAKTQRWSVPPPGPLSFAPRPIPISKVRAYDAMAWAWLGGSLILGLRLVMANRRLAREIKRSKRIGEPRTLGLLEDCASLMGVKRLPVLLSTRYFDGPAVVGCLRPKLLLPENLETALTSAELRHIFMHELAHIRRRDMAMNWLLRGLEAVHWFNPIMRYVFRRIHADRELACDDLVLSRIQPGESSSYGRTILKLLDGLAKPAVMPGLVGLLEEKKQMRRRIEMIAHRPSPKNPWLAAVLFVGLGLFTLTDAQNAAPQAEDSTQLQALAFSPEALRQERETDKQHLRLIYQAIQAYYRDHQDLPNWLSDLVPVYLPDTGVLISPIETRTGKSILFGREDPKIHTSYIYEFNAAPAPEDFNKGRTTKLSCKEWKLMQLQKFGMVTPILRSHIDQPVLNVAYSGQIYETGLLWENDPNAAALVKQNALLGPPKGQLPGPRLTVHVIDAQTGAPIPSAIVRNGIGSEFGLLPPGHGATDPDGNVGVPLGDWKVNFLFLNASRAGYCPLGFEWNRERSQQDAPPSEVTLKLRPKTP